jgi:hypothetical protein
VLLTRPPLSPQTNPRLPFDLHVLSTPPAFILSQDQTLRKLLLSTTHAVDESCFEPKLYGFPITLQLLRFCERRRVSQTRAICQAPSASFVTKRHQPTTSGPMPLVLRPCSLVRCALSEDDITLHSRHLLFYQMPQAMSRADRRLAEKSTSQFPSGQRFPVPPYPVFRWPPLGGWYHLSRGWRILKDVLTPVKG